VQERIAPGKDKAFWSFSIPNHIGDWYSWDSMTRQQEQQFCCLARDKYVAGKLKIPSEEATNLKVAKD
jgi:hypothetical protein